MAFVASEGDSVFFVPLIIRAIPPDLAGDEQWFDASCPRGYPGPIAGPRAPAQDDVFVAHAIGALGDVLRERRIVSAFVRCHPLLSPPLDLLRGGGAIVEHGESVSIDLASSPAEAWSAIRENHRRAIVHARMNGYAMRIDESWARLDDFLVIHALAMDAHRAAAHWRNSARLRHGPPDRSHAPSPPVRHREGRRARRRSLDHGGGRDCRVPPCGNRGGSRVGEPDEAPHRGGRPVGARPRQPRLPPGREPAPRRWACPLQAWLLTVAPSRRLLASRGRSGGVRSPCRSPAGAGRTDGGPCWRGPRLLSGVPSTERSGCDRERARLTAAACGEIGTTSGETRCLHATPRRGRTAGWKWCVSLEGGYGRSSLVRSFAALAARRYWPHRRSLLRSSGVPLGVWLAGGIWSASSK